MKLFVKLLSAAAVLAILLPFTFLKGKDGKPLMSFDKLVTPDLAMPKMPANFDSTGSAGEDIIYKWRDSNGELNFTSSPPSEGIEYTAKGYDPNANLIQSVTIKEDEPETTVTNVGLAGSKSEEPKPAEIGNPYSPQKIEKLVNDAQNVQKLLNDRMQQQEALLGR